jgi:hypothetical protein
LDNVHVDTNARLAGERSLARHFQQIVVSSASAILHVSLDHGQKRATPFHLGIGQPRRAEQFRSAALKPLESTRIVKRAHLVSFAIPNAK